MTFATVRYCLLYALLLACNGSKSTDGKSVPQLELIASYEMDMAEPSGLSVGAGGLVLWAVGNNPERIYKLTVEGKTLETLTYKGDDLEGIVFDAVDSTLWIVEEERREVIQLDLGGTVLRRHELDLTGKRNSGLEGISFGGQHHLWVLNEKNPGMLVMLADDLSINSRQELDFASDYSALAYDRLRECFWIASHEDETLYLWSEAAGVAWSYSAPFPKVEGVAMDEDSQRLYVVSETDQTLHVYSLPAPLNSNIR